MAKRRGRPRKDPDRIEPAQLFRAGKIVSLYERARRKGEKHTAAIADVVEKCKKKNPTGQISMTGVKRMLARFRPQSAQVVLQFEPSPVDNAEIKRLQDMFRSAAQGMHRLGIEPGVDISKFEPRNKYTVGFGPKELFPRHNRKVHKR